MFVDVTRRLRLRPLHEAVVTGMCSGVPSLPMNSFMSVLMSVWD